jgi:tRNA(adenine34) deaminase
MTDEQLMREALKEAAIARDSGNWAVGCVITLNGKIVARGRNKVYSEKNRLLHAEVDAILKLQEHYFEPGENRFVLYTTLEPCPMCFGSLLLTNIRTIIAGTNLDNSGSGASMEHVPEFFTQPHHKTKMRTGLLEAECEEMWLSGEPIQKLLARGVRLELSSGNRRPRSYETPTKTTVSGLKKNINRSAQDYLVTLKAMLSSSK